MPFPYLFCTAGELAPELFMFTLQEGEEGGSPGPPWSVLKLNCIGMEGVRRPGSN